MSDKKTHLIFMISNSPLLHNEYPKLRKNNWRHRIPCYCEKTLSLELVRTALNSDTRFKIETALPKELQTYIIEYAGEKDFKIYKTKESDKNTGKLVFETVLEFYNNNANYLEENKPFVYGDQIDVLDCFFKLAWFEDICGALQSKSRKMKGDEYTELKCSKTIIDSLKMIGENPELLRDGCLVEDLITFLNDAKDKDYKEDGGAQESRKILAKYLIPKKIKVFNLRKEALAIDLMMKLARHIICQCEKVLGISLLGKNNHKRGAVCKLTEKQLSDLKAWARANNEARIAILSNEKLSMLLLSPATYVNDLLKISKKYKRQ